jgi:hypothetical protein
MIRQVVLLSSILVTIALFPSHVTVADDAAPKLQQLEQGNKIFLGTLQQKGPGEGRFLTCQRQSIVIVDPHNIENLDLRKCPSERFLYAYSSIIFSRSRIGKPLKPELVDVSSGEHIPPAPPEYEKWYTNHWDFTDSLGDAIANGDLMAVPNTAGHYDIGRVASNPHTLQSISSFSDQPIILCDGRGTMRTDLFRVLPLKLKVCPTGNDYGQVSAEIESELAVGAPLPPATPQ